MSRRPGIAPDLATARTGAAAEEGVRRRRFYAFCNGVKLHYLEYGSDGPDVLLLPGITSPAITWDFVARRLAVHARILVLDARGKGLSDQRPGLTYRLDDYAGDAAEFLLSLGLRSAVVLGHSVGARVAVRLAARYPERVSRLVLVDPPVTGPGRRSYPIPLDYYLENIAKASRGEPVAARPTWNDEQIAMRAEWLPSCSPEAVAETYRHMHDEDIHGDLADIRCETLLVYAEEGGTVTDEEAEELVGRIPTARKIKIPGVGHMIPWDDLDAFLDSVTDELAGIGHSAGTRGQAASTSMEGERR